MNPPQHERDINSILSIIDIVKHGMDKKGAFLSKDKMKVLFHPQPKTADLAELADNLTVNLEPLEPKEKKEVYDTIEETYKVNLEELYKSAMNKESFEGADIWHFMKDDVKNKCIVDSPAYKNVLIIFTDGYLYWPYDKINEGHRYNYITGAYKHFSRFRNAHELSTTFDKEDYGLIPVQKDLSNLDIMVIGINPPKKYPQDFDIVKKYWSKWFEEMNVHNYKILKTDLPSYTSKEISRFISLQ